MNSKNSITVALMFSLAIIGCRKQTLVENIDIDPVPKNSAEYYANLRTYKKTKHQIYYAWIGGFGADGTPGKVGVLDHIPDSIDIVSCWGGVPKVGTHNFNLLQQTRKLKGTRFVGVTIVGDHLLTRVDSSFFEKYNNGSTSYNGNNDSLLTVGFKLAAKSLADWVDEHELDGYDFDYEPKGLLSSRKAFELYILEVSKYLGPKSGTGKLLVVDAFVENITKETVPCVDYFVLQNYSPQGGQPDITNRINNQAPGLPLSKAVSAENFESVWSTGGLLLEYAKWNPPGGKGGAGSYHTEYEYALNPDYKYTRQAIQIMNPAAK